MTGLIYFWFFIIIMILCIFTIIKKLIKKLFPKQIKNLETPSPYSNKMSLLRNELLSKIKLSNIRIISKKSYYCDLLFLKNNKKVTLVFNNEFYEDFSILGEPDILKMFTSDERLIIYECGEELIRKYRLSLEDEEEARLDKIRSKYL